MVRLLSLYVPLLFALQYGSATAQRRRLPANGQGSSKTVPAVTPAPAPTTRAPTTASQATTPPAWLGLNLYEVASRGIAFPTCGDIGQNESFQGAPLRNAKGECVRVNICHGNAGFGWNRITVDRSALGVDNKGNGGHANQEHNDRSQKRPDFFPGAISIANPRGAGINGGLDGSCNWVGVDGSKELAGDEPPEMPAPVTPATLAPAPTTRAPTTTPPATLPGSGNGNGNGNGGGTTPTTTLVPSLTTQATIPPAWLGLNLYEVASRGIAFPTCGDIGQNESFQGAPLRNAKGECVRVNICHGNAGFGWNRITVDRSALGVDNKGNGGHANQEHNDRAQKRPDFFPGAISIANPRGAGINGGLDGSCNWVGADGSKELAGDEPPEMPAPVTPAPVATAPVTSVTPAPVTPVTPAPVTPAPVTSVIPAPVIPVTPAPVTSVTPAPVTPVTPAPVTPAPVTSVTPAPVTPVTPVTPAPTTRATTPPAPDVDPTDTTTDNAFARGDPHFKTFGGELYDYHGQCDLVLLENPQFKNGLGMTIHIRTKIQDFWSSVESAAIKIGDDVIEVAGGSSNEWLWVNGEANGELEEGKWDRFSIAGFLVRFKQSGLTREVNIYIEGLREHVVIKAYRDFVRVDIPWLGSKNFDGSTGLLGSHTLNGKRVGRDGETFISDVNEFGQEWQVLEAEDQLFHNYDSNVVQAPAKCMLPPPASAEQARRRLKDSDLTFEMAEAACAHVQGEGEQKACIYDILATQDINMAGAW